MKRFIPILSIIVALSLSAIAPVINATDDPCIIWSSAELKEWNNLQKNADYKKVSEPLMTAINNRTLHGTKNSLPEFKAYQAFLDNYWTKFRKKNPELVKPYNKCLKINLGTKPIYQEFKNTDSYKKFIAKEITFEQFKEAQKEFFKKHGYVQVPNVGYRKIATTK